VAHVLAELRQRLDATVLMVTHDSDLAADFADRLVLLRDGTIGYDGPPAAALSDPALLASYGVQPPALAELSALLRQRGLPLRFHTLPEAERALLEHLAQGDPCRP
jgi:energy-coupling factor transport system ATP-binding protein